MKMPEKFLHLVWNHLLFDSQNLLSIHNERIRILKKGCYNHGQGPDFKEAVINIDGIEWNGNIELETESHHWFLHQHHQNPEFNNVILLVCYEHTSQEIVNSNGWEIPVLVLKPFIFQDATYKLEILLSQEVPCKPFIKDYPKVLQKNLFIQKAIERLEDKVSSFKNLDVEIISWQILWKAFGTPYHSNLFLEIAQQLSPSIFFSSDTLQEKEALVFGIAGFFNGNIDCPYFKELKALWNYLKQKYGLNEVSPKCVNFKTRTHSFPNLLIAQLVAWLHHYGNLLLFPKKEYFDNFGEISTYWKKNIFFNKPSKISYNVGKQKINKLLLNWYYPFRWYYIQYYEPELLEKLLEEYSITEKENNAIIKKLEKWGWSIENGLESQGATQLYKKYCIEKRCLDCAFGQWLLKNNKKSNITA